MNPAVIEIKAFVPAHDIEKSIQFYKALGFEIVFASDELAHIRYGTAAFLLQAYNHPEFTRNYMMSLQVESADDWHAHVMASGVVEQFGIMIQAPEDRPWGMRDFPMSDPSGVLWRVAQSLNKAG